MVEDNLKASAPTPGVRVAVGEDTGGPGMESVADTWQLVGAHYEMHDITCVLLYNIRNHF